MKQMTSKTIQEIERCREPYIEIIKILQSDRDSGLDKKEVKKRLSLYGPNIFKRKSSISPLKILIDQFKNIIIVLLIIAAVISFVIGDTLEGAAVLAVIIINALFGFFTEYRAERSVETLKEMITTRAKVIRNNVLKEINAKQLVPGDIIIIEEGDSIAADARIIESDNLAVDEASLTGESEPVSKHPDKIDKTDIPLAEQKNMVFMGTAVTRGNGAAVVTATGAKTEMGKISDLLSMTEEQPTPLEKKLDQMGKSLIGITLGIAAIITLVGIISGNNIMDMLKTGIALAIAAVPEGLPAVATITLAIGMKKMVKQKALVKSLPAVETLGSTTVICTDKTGTLTENQMTVEKICTIDQEITVTGTGYTPYGSFKSNDRTVEISDNAGLELFLQAGTLCSNAVVSEQNELWKVIGDPTDGALVTVARKGGFDRQQMEKTGHRRIDEVPFSSDAKYMAVSCTMPDNREMVFLKGAPGIIIDMCSSVLTRSDIQLLDQDIKKQLLKQNNELAREGLRVIAVAYKKKTSAALVDDVQSGMVFLGLAGITDPPRSDIKWAISQSRNAGIRTIMITGDQSDTAIAIGKKIGLASPQDQAITGTELDGFTTQTLAEKIKTHSVFARVSPKNKLDIVDALNNNNEITAMTGDGVNDAPALKKADIGVAMGQRGTAVAKEAADMILLDDNFSTIVEAVRQGRVIFDNIIKFVHYLFSCNLSEIIFIFVGIILQVPTPLLALQILWLNLVTDVFPALVMAWEKPEDNVMSQPPRNPGQAILTKHLKLKIGLQGLLIASGPLLAYLYALNTFTIAQSRTIGFMTLAFVQLFHVFNVRRKHGLGFDMTLLKNAYFWGAFVLTFGLQIFAVYVPFMQRILHTSPLSFSMWKIILIGAVLPVLCIQIYSIIKKYKK